MNDMLKLLLFSVLLCFQLDAVLADGVSYTYYPDTRLKTRTWSRDILTNHEHIHSPTGRIHIVTYSDGTPGKTNYFNLVNNLAFVKDATGIRTFTYTPVSKQKSENNHLATIERSYDKYGRYSGYKITPANTTLPVHSIQYGYDQFSRLSSVNSIIGNSTNSFIYNYLPCTKLITGYLCCRENTNEILRVSRSYEKCRDLITTVTNFAILSSSVISAFDYTNDPLGRQNQCVNSFNGVATTNQFFYNARSEITNSTVYGNDYETDFDAIGNRIKFVINDGANTKTNYYTANQLNQYTAITGWLTSSPSYDADGNNTFDGVWHHSWDGENRLIQSLPHSQTNGSILIQSIQQQM